MTLDDIRKTSDNKLAGSIRILLAVLFLMTGVMKLRLTHARRSLVRPVAIRSGWAMYRRAAVSKDSGGLPKIS